MRRWLCGAGAFLVSAVTVSGPLAAGPRDLRMQSAGRVLDTRAAAESNRPVRLAPRRVHTPSKFPGPDLRGRYRSEYTAPARAAARRNRVPEGLFLRLVAQESGWNPEAVSHKGAVGLAQLMPATARRLGADPTDPRQNLDAGARYLRRQYEAFRSWRLALAAYNAGPEAVRRHGGVPPFAETRNYVRVIFRQ